MKLFIALLDTIVDAHGEIMWNGEVIGVYDSYELAEKAIDEKSSTFFRKHNFSIEEKNLNE